MKKILSTLLALAMLVPTFGALPAAAADSEAQYVAVVYNTDGSIAEYCYSVGIAMVAACAGYGNRTVKLLADSNEDGPSNVIGGNSITLDLNGHKIKRDRKNNMSDKNGSVITLGESADLTIIDTSESQGGTIEGGGAKWGGGIYAPKNNVVTMNAGTITNCTAYYGGGVYVDESSKFIMNGGKIDHCYSKYGGGVYVEDKATFETHGGQITNNIAEEDGGGIYVWSAFAKLNDSYIGHNHADEGGGIYSDYNSSKMYSYITISGSTIEGNTSQSGYGGIYHNDGGLALKYGTTVVGNYTNGKYGGGVYSEKCKIELAGGVWIYGNTSNSYEPCDVSFGKNLDAAFSLSDSLSSSSFIGVYTRYHAPEAWYYDMHISGWGYCDEKSDLEKVNPLKDALFSNSGSNGFACKYWEEFNDNSTSASKRHYVKIINSGAAVEDDINVTRVYYKNMELPKSDFSSSYNSVSRTIFLRVPKYVKEYSSLSVETDNPKVNFWQGSHLATSTGWGDVVSTRYGLVVKNVNDSPSYTVSVENGKVDGIEPENGISSTKKEFFDGLKIEPIVPEDKMFSHWEVEGDYTTDHIIGYNQYIKIPLYLLMPNGNVRFKAVLKNKVSTVDVEMFGPKVGSRTPFYTKDLDDPCIKATAAYKAKDGTVLHKEEIDVVWSKRHGMFDGTAIHYFDYYADYLANFQIEDTEDGDFCLAKYKDLTMNLYWNGEPLNSNAYSERYEYVYGDGTDPWNSNNDNQPIKRHILHVTRYYTSEKAPIRKSIPSQIKVPMNTTKEVLKSLLPESVNVRIADISYSNGGEQPEVKHCPVVWNTDNLPDKVTGRLEIKGIYNTAKEGFEVKENENIYPTIIVDPDTQELSEMPQVTVDGTPVTAIGNMVNIALGKKIGLVTSMENADIYYSLNGEEYKKYEPGTEIELQGKENEIVENKIEAYAEAGGTRSETLDTIVEVDNKTKYTVNIVDPNGSEYIYATGAGEYKIGAEVAVDLTQKYMRNPWKSGYVYENVSDPHKTATTWSAKGRVFDDNLKAEPIFTFEMPNSSVIIKIETFKDLHKTHTVTIVDQEGNPYEYASGAGEYKENDTVTIDSTEFTLKSVNAEGLEISELKPTTANEKVVSQWSAEGVELTDKQKQASKFEFKMPYNDVVIKVEAFRPLVKKVYLSSIIPVAGKPLPDKLEILSATDVYGNTIDKEDIMLKTEIPDIQGGAWTIKGGEDDGKIVKPGTIAELGKTYVTFFSVQQISADKKALVDDYEIYMNGKQVEPDPIFDKHMIKVQTEAAKDELLAVDWGTDVDGATFYNVKTAVNSLPKKVKIRTKYGTVEDNMAEIEWSNTDKMMSDQGVSSVAFGNYEPVATLKLPDNVDDVNGKKSKRFTVKVRKPVSSISFMPMEGSILAKAGETFSQYIRTSNLNMTGAPLEFRVLSEDNTDVKGKVAEAGKRYTVRIKVRPQDAQNTFTENTKFTINGKAMDIVSVTKSDSSYGDIYELSYTFTAEETKEYDVAVNGAQPKKYKNGDTVDISTDKKAFYNWTAEAVYTTKETVAESDGTTQKEIEVEHRNPINPFKAGAEYEATTSFVMPLLVDDNARLELTANYSYGINAYDRATRKADIFSDKAYSGVEVLFAAYDKFDNLLSVEMKNVDLTEGENIVDAPEAFAASADDGADKVRIMVWNNFDDATPVFNAFEMSVAGENEQ